MKKIIFCVFLFINCSTTYKIYNEVPFIGGIQGFIDWKKEISRDTCWVADSTGSFIIVKCKEMN